MNEIIFSEIGDLIQSRCKGIEHSSNLIADRSKSARSDMVPSRKMNAYITSSTTGGQSIMDDRKEIEIHPPEDVDLPLDSKVEFNEGSYNFMTAAT